MIGFMLIDKPVGPTSHDVVDTVRRAVGIRRVGHAGTLDPPASGLVVVGVGAATRLLRFVQKLPKTYETTGVLGVRTSTLDASGAVVSTEPVRVVEPELREALAAFLGPIEQVPPAVSAVKIGGERAYKRASRGEDVELKPRTVTVHSLVLTGFEAPEFSLGITCSSGTYVRSLVADIGDRLGCGAHVKELRRVAIGHLSVEDAVAPEHVTPAALESVDRVLRHLPTVRAGADEARRARSGQRLHVRTDEGHVLVEGPDGPVGVFESKDGILRPVTVLGGPGGGASAAQESTARPDPQMGTKREASGPPG